MGHPWVLCQLLVGRPWMLIGNRFVAHGLPMSLKVNYCTKRVILCNPSMPIIVVHSDEIFQ